MLKSEERDDYVAADVLIAVLFAAVLLAMGMGWL